MSSITTGIANTMAAKANKRPYSTISDPKEEENILLTRAKTCVLQPLVPRSMNCGMAGFLDDGPGPSELVRADAAYLSLIGHG